MSYKILLIIFFVMRIYRRAILCIILPMLCTSQAFATASEQLKAGINAIKTYNIDKAINIQHNLPQNSPEANILLWTLGVCGTGNMPSAIVKLALTKLPSWPAHSKIEANFEKAWYKELLPQPTALAPKLTSANAEAIMQYFSKKPPITAEGMALWLAGAKAKHRMSAIHNVLASWWYTRPLAPKEQAIILANAGPLLSSIDHVKRLRMLLLRRYFESAKQLAPLAYATPIVKAFIAVDKNKKHALNLLTKQKKKWQSDPIYEYAYIEYLRQNDKYIEAATRLEHLPKSSAFLVYPTAWWKLRMALSDELLDLGQTKKAYNLLKNPETNNKSHAAEQEFRAGWIALRFLQKPRLAITHFISMKNYAQTNSYQAKTYYWLGRCYQQLQNTSLAKTYYNKSASYSTAYYGQLSAATLGRHNLNLSIPKAPLGPLKTKLSLQILDKLHVAGDADYVRLWAINLAYALKAREELLLLIYKMAGYQDYYAALKIAKIAANKGVDVGALTHIIGAIPQQAKLSASEKALAYAIARQESEFNTEAVSSSGALGLMQLLPKTAKELAHKGKAKFLPDKLTDDAAYNAQLGIKFVQKQLTKFTGSYLLTFAAYNAGPGRTAQWIKRYGDPRKMTLYKVIDWVERIPYSETRNYVMRVMENYEIYKARLGTKVDFIKDLRGYNQAGA